MEQFTNALQEFVNLVLQAAVPILAGLVVFWLKAQVQIAMQKLENSKPQLAWAIKQAVSLAVQAAEQAELAGYIEDKKEYAMGIAESWLDQNGWDEIDIVMLDAAIEAEVLKLFTKDRDGQAVVYGGGSSW